MDVFLDVFAIFWFHRANQNDKASILNEEEVFGRFLDVLDAFFQGWGES
jgi:hypothetical protein